MPNATHIQDLATFNNAKARKILHPITTANQYWYKAEISTIDAIAMVADYVNRRRETQVYRPRI